MYRHHMHTSKTVPVAGGLYKATCSCGWESSEWAASRFADEALEIHKKQAMAAQEREAGWDNWLNQYADVLSEADRDEDHAILAYHEKRRRRS